MERIFRQGGQAFNAQREMRAAPVVHDGVNLIQDQRARRAQHPPARFGSEQQIQRLWRRNEDVRRLFNQRLPLRGSRIASAHFGAHIDLPSVSLAHERANSSKRLLKIFADIVAQRLERRHINHLRFMRQISVGAFAEKRIERSKERRQRFAGTSRRRNQDVPTRLYCRPAAQLRFGR